MRRGIELALLGQGNVAPNPMVGAVIVYNDKIIGEGYHLQFGGPHAEVNAVNSVQDNSLLPQSTIYVTLEPCSHFGKTPPCVDLIIKHKFKRVVIGSRDPYAEVNGNGIERLKQNEIDITLNCLEEECRNLNKHFFTFHEQRRPFIFLKWAQTINGKIDNGANDQKITWISSPESKTLVHQWRKQYQAILIGKNTVENDNPSLTVRAVNGKNPIRIILDSNASLKLDYNVFNNEAKTYVFNLIREEKIDNVEFIQLNNMSIEAIIKKLTELNIISILIEGGTQTLQSFIDTDLWDEVAVLEGKTTFNEGTNAPILNKKSNYSFEYFGDTVSLYSKNEKI